MILNLLGNIVSTGCALPPVLATAAVATYAMVDDFRPSWFGLCLVTTT
jgi:hypothetical protein